MDWTEMFAPDDNDTGIPLGTHSAIVAKAEPYYDGAGIRLHYETDYGTLTNPYRITGGTPADAWAFLIDMLALGLSRAALQAYPDIETLCSALEGRTCRAEVVDDGSGGIWLGKVHAAP